MKILSSAITRLTLWYAAVLGIFLVLFAIGAYLVFDYGLTAQADRAMTEVAGLFEGIAREEVEDDEEEVEGDVFEAAFKEAALDVNFKKFRISVFSSSNDFSVQSEAENENKKISAKRVSGLKGVFDPDGGVQFYTFSENGNSVRVLFKPLRIEGNVSYLYILHDLDEQHVLLSQVRNAFGLFVPIALILAGFGGYFLARKSFSPIAKMTRKAEEITARSLHERLPVGNDADELGRLAKAFNELLERLRRSFDQQKRFMADASHELRTPAAILLGESEVTLKKEDRSPDEYRESLSIIQKEAGRMSFIIEDLFTLARADAGENPVTKTDFYLEDILSEVVTAFRSLAAQRDIEVELDSPFEMEYCGDEQLILRLFSNLIDNAVKHARSKVSVSAKPDNESYLISITDDGNGIPEESIPHIFDRFYRVDSARSRKMIPGAGSGAGLGLSISKWITDSHSATLVLTDSSTSGSVFTVTFPKTKK